MDYNDNKKVELAKKIYLYLGAIFITSLVVSNLIFQILRNLKVRI